MDDELHDDELRRDLGRLAGTGRDAASELESLRPRFHRARRRRQMQLLGAGMACAAVLGAFTASLDRGDHTIVQHTTNGGSITVAPEPEPTMPSATSMPAVTATSIAPATASVPTPTQPPDTTPSGTAAPHASSAPPTSAVPTTTAVTARPAAAPLSSERSPGGSVTYRAEGGVLTLVSVEPAPGFIPTVKDQRFDRITVRFERRDGQSSEIDVRVDHGQVQVEVK